MIIYKYSFQIINQKLLEILKFDKTMTSRDVKQLKEFKSQVNLKIYCDFVSVNLKI